MIDIFISYTSRAEHTSRVFDKHAWIREFDQQLRDGYLKCYGSKISTWFYTAGDVYGPADDYRKEIEKALPQSLIFMPVLDPDYLKSPECRQELIDYQEFKNEQKTPANILKVVIERSVNKSDIDSLGGATLIRSTLCDQTNTLYPFDSDEFREQLEMLVKAVRKIKLHELYSQSLQYLDKIDSKINIYTTLGFSRSLNTNRDRLLKQLNETLKRGDFSKNITYQTLPDQLQLIDIDYDSIIDMASYEDPKRNEWFEKVIEKTHVVIVPVEFEDIAGAEDFSKNIYPQLNIIKKQALERENLRVFFLLNVPETMFQMDEFADAFDSPVINGQKNFTIVKKRDIADFIDIIINTISPPKTLPPPVENKFIYMIESNQAMFNNSSNLSEPEKDRRKKFRTYILGKGYGLLPYIEEKNLDDAAKQHSQNLALSSGVIIYKGTVEEKSWSINQQAEIFKVLYANNKLNLNRAIYLDPDEKDREVGSYGYFNYSVLLKFTDELDTFLTRI